MLITCSKCKADKPATADVFPLNPKKKNGFDSWCRSCYANRKKMERRGKYRGMISDQHLKILLESVSECTICGETGTMQVDHDHKRNIIRGLLCNRCNLGLGHFRDDPDLLEFARIYILASLDDNEARAFMEE